MASVRVLLVSTYELGHQPVLVASAAGALRQAGHEVRAVDVALQPLTPEPVAWAQAVALAVPMHTAARLARAVAGRLRTERPELPLCFYGLYAMVAAEPAGDDGGRCDLAVAGETDAELVAWARQLDTQQLAVTAGAGAERHAGRPARPGADAAQGAPLAPRRVVTLRRGPSSPPARDVLPPPSAYARLQVGGEQRLAAAVEASRGCTHRCRHCPVPVVYDGRIRVVPVETVVADVAGLVEQGVRHVTFSDPDFLNGPQHARRVVDAVHGAFPELTFDVTVKVEHVLRHRDLWPHMAASGCLFVVSAFESATDRILAVLDKGHSVADSVEAVAVLRAEGIEPRPSLLPFTPWTNPEDLAALVDLVAGCDLGGNVDAVQYSIRLLVPPGSLLLTDGLLTSGQLDGYDPELLGWRWRSPDPALDALQQRLAALAEQAGDEGWDTPTVTSAVRDAVGSVVPGGLGPAPEPPARLRSALPPELRPRLTEAWFCCAEPTGTQLQSAGGCR